MHCNLYTSHKINLYVIHVNVKQVEIVIKTRREEVGVDGWVKKLPEFSPSRPRSCPSVKPEVNVDVFVTELPHT